MLWHKHTIMKTTELEYAYTIFKVVGDSMDDGTRSSFENGDYLFVDPVGTESLKNCITDDLGSFWVIITGCSTMLKQITGYDETEGVKCHSLNPGDSYGDFYIEDEIIFYYIINQSFSQT